MIYFPVLLAHHFKTHNSHTSNMKYVFWNPVNFFVNLA